MANHLLEQLTAIGNWSYLIIFLVVFAESGLLLLVPGETAVLLGGALVWEGVLKLPPLMAVAAIGALLGDATGYLLGRGPGRRRYLSKGRFLFLREPEVERTRGWLVRSRGWAIVGARFVSLLRVATPFVCGLTNLPAKNFFPYDVPACIVWGIALSLAGWAAGDAWEQLRRWLGHLSLALLLIALVALGIWAWRSHLQSRSAKVGK